MMLSNIQLLTGHPLDLIPMDIWGVIARKHLSLQDLISLALTDIKRNICADFLFDRVTKEFLLSEGALKDRKVQLYQLCQKLHSTFIRSIHRDIDLIKNRVFQNGILTVNYWGSCFTPFFLSCFAAEYLKDVMSNNDITEEDKQLFQTKDVWDEERVIKECSLEFRSSNGLIEIKALRIRQISSNSIENQINPKFVKALKKASELFFIKLCENYIINDLDTNFKLEKSRLIISREKKELLCDSLGDVFRNLLTGSNLYSKLNIIYHGQYYSVEGEKEDIQKFVEILEEQRFANRFPTFDTLLKANEKIIIKC